MILKRSLVLALSIGLLAGCDDDDDPTGVDVMAQISGSWQAQSFTYTRDEGGDQIDVIGQLGGSLVLNIQQSGQFTGTVIIPGVTPGAGFDVGGTLNVSGNTIAVDFNTQSEALFSDFDATYTLSSSGNTFTWTATEVDFDFPGDNVEGEVDADLTVVLARTSS